MALQICEVSVKLSGTDNSHAVMKHDLAEQFCKNA